MAVRISRDVLEQILAEARAAPDREICGLLLGDDADQQIFAAQPAANVADDLARRFEIDPLTLIAAHRTARAGGSVMLGHYHSHPLGGVEPSPCDAEMARADGALWLICGPDGSYTIWRAGSTGMHGRFAKCDIVIDE